MNAMSVGTLVLGGSLLAGGALGAGFGLGEPHSPNSDGITRSELHKTGQLAVRGTLIGATSGVALTLFWPWPNGLRSALLGAAIVGGGLGAFGLAHSLTN